MSESTREFTDREFALILSKAAELARSSGAAERPAAGFSLEEMKAIAAEAGLDPVLVERAARLIPSDSSGSRIERMLGGPVKYRGPGWGPPAGLRDPELTHLYFSVLQFPGISFWT